jgi:predicted dehydrogenase
MSKTSAGKQNSSAYPRLILIGCGAIAECFYLPAIAKYPQVLNNIVLVDSNISRVQSLAAKYNIRNCSSDYKGYLGKIDGAIIAAPNRFHFPISLDFLKSGTHVLCEKPLTEQSMEAKQLIELAKKNEIALVVNQTRRLFPSNLKVKELFLNHEIGEILSIQYYEGWKFSWPTASGFYFNPKLQTKGILIDIGAHILDLICWWLGEKPDQVACETDSFGGPESVATVRFAYQGCKGDVKLSRLSQLQNRFRIVGKAATIESRAGDWNTLWLTSQSGGTTRLSFSSPERQFNDFADRIVSNFIDVIARGAPPLVPARDVLPSIECLESCYQSSKRFNMPWYESQEVINDRR